MDFKIGRLNLNAVAQGVGGLVFGNEDSNSSEDSYVERFLDRISNGVRAEDRRAAMAELQSVVAESRSAQLAFGAMGFPVLLTVLKEERDDVEMIRGALETLVSALTPIETAHGAKNDVQPASMNSDLLSRESENIALLLSLLSEDDFYVRYYTLQLLTALLTHSPNRLQEAILSIPRGITRLMDMLMDREVIRNEALLLLTYLTCEAEEIQKIVVFEGAFEKIFSIIQEEGGSDGGVVVQDCLELLKNLIRKNASNQMLLKETTGFDPIISILKLRRGSAFNFTQQKTINLLNALETIDLLLMGGLEDEPGREANRLSNQNALAQKKILDHLIMLGVESQWASVSVRCLALRCIGDLVMKNPHNLDSLANKLVGEEPHVEPALNAILRITLRTTIIQEFVAADYVFKCFCEKNTVGQALLASTMVPQLHSSSNFNIKDEGSMPFGSLLLHALLSSDGNGDLETCCRAASVLCYILKDNAQCRERVLKIELDVPVPSLGSPESLLHRIVKFLSLAVSTRSKDNGQGRTNAESESYIQPIILRLLITWLADCPKAVKCLLDSPPHLTYLLELVSSPSASVFVRGLASVLLGECILYSKSEESGKDAFSVVDAISQKIGLTTYFLNFDALQKSFMSISPSAVQHLKPLSRSSAASMVDMEEIENDEMNQRHEHDPVLAAVFDSSFVIFLKKLEVDIRNIVVDVYSHTKSNIAVVPAELEQKDGESDKDYIKRLKTFIEKQCIDMQDLLGRNATLAEEMARTGRTGASDPADKPSRGRQRVQFEALRQELKQAVQSVEELKSGKAKLEAEASHYLNLAGKLESDLKSLSDAYNSLEQDNYRLESEVNALRKDGNTPYPDVEAIKAEAREEAERESLAELNDLLVCLGQEQSKVEKLSSRLTDLGEDVDSLLEGIGDETGLPDDDDDDEDDK
ncbi:hypothetical protein DsansV1_C05g0057981 [Dioscorea sansibarensis]